MGGGRGEKGRGREEEGGGGRREEGVWGGGGVEEERRHQQSGTASQVYLPLPHPFPFPFHPFSSPPRTHGSVLFTRGETQALCVATLGSKTDALRSESIRSGGGGELPGDSFYLHYFFPPSSVGEVGKVGGPGEEVAAE